MTSPLSLARAFAPPVCRSLVAMEEWLLAGQPDRVHQLVAEPSDGSPLRRIARDGTAE